MFRNVVSRNCISKFATFDEPNEKISYSFAPMLRDQHLLIWWLVANSWALSNLCPVSQSYGVSQRFHGYPLSIYYQHNLLHSKSRSCNVVNDVDHTTKPIQQCDNQRLCPVKEENIQSALQVAPWPQYVDTFNRLGKDEHINVFYLGGSMTQGTEAGRKCIATEGFFRDTIQVLPSSSICSWPSHLSRWLQHTYPATTFYFHDFSAGGRTSQSSDFFIDMVRRSKANLSNPALFFLDYSVNDAQAHVFSGIETFLRTIIGYFGRHYRIKPTIVVIEQFPHAHFRGPATDEGLNTDIDYAMAYRLISQHYNAVLISVREVFWTYFGEPNSRNLMIPNLTLRYYPISPFEQHVHMWVHPPWYVHLYVADVLAACILRITASFNSNTTGQTTGNTIHNLHDQSTTPNVSYTPTTYVLPPSLYNNTIEIQYMCDLTAPYAVDATPHPLPHTGKVNMTQGWVLTHQHHAAGWIVNNHAVQDKRTLSFPFHSPHSPIKDLHGHILKVTYLRSYEGMGMVSLLLCGLPLTEPVVIDGQWSYPVSLPQIYSAILSDADILHCESLPTEKHTVDVVYQPGTSDETARSKHNHQFKMCGLEVCAPTQFKI